MAVFADQELLHDFLSEAGKMIQVILAATGEVKQMFRQTEGQRQQEPSDAGLLRKV
jgi:hypothetical protein